MAINELEDLQRGRGPSSASGNEYDAMISDQADSQKNVLRGTMFAAARKQPDRQAQVMELAQRAKLPASVVERNFDDVSKKVNEKALDYDQMIEQTPGLAKWMENTENAALGREDLDPLGRMDKNARALNKRSDVTTLPDELRRAGTTGFRGIESSSWHLAAAYGLATPEEAAEQVANANRRANELREMAPDYAKEFSQTMAAESGDVNKAWNKFTGSYKQAREGKILQAMMDWHNGAIETVGEAVDMIGAAAVRPRGLMYSTVENLANSLPSILTGVAGAKVAAAGAAIAGQLGPQVAVPEEIVTVPVAGMVGFAAGSFMGAVPVEVGAWINSEMQSRGVDVTDAQAITAAYKDPKMMADIRAEAERKGLTTAGVDALFNAFAGRLVKGAKPGMASKAIAGAKEIGIQTAGEVTSEYAGQVAAKEGDLSKTNFGEAIQEGIISLGHSAADVTVGASMRAAFNKNPTRAAEEVHAATETALQGLHEAQLLGEMGKAAKELKHTGTVPGKVAELLDAAGAPSSVYFQTKDWDAYWRSKGKSPAKAAEQLMDDGGKAYFEAKKTGRDIEIPFSSYIDKTARTEDFDGLLPSAKTSPGGMSATEAREHLTTLPATMNELAKEVSGAMAQDNTAEQSAKEVGKTVSEQLKEVGVDPDQAVLYEEGFRVLGERMGMDPKELFDQYKLRITGERTQAEGQSYDQAAAKKPAPPMYSKLEQTIQQKMGGSQDTKSLRAMLKDIKPEEMKWSGLEDLLKSKEKVTKQEVLDHLRANQLEIKEISKGGSTTEEERGEFSIDQGDDDIWRITDWAGNEMDGEFDTFEAAEEHLDSMVNNTGATKFSQYTLPGGENYREVLFTMPPKDNPGYYLTNFETGEKVELDQSLTYQQLLNAVNEKKKEDSNWRLAAPEAPKDRFSSSHFDEANVLAHTRLNERTDADGKRVLFVEEIQSDWHQAGRKRGYKGDADPTIDQNAIDDVVAGRESEANPNAYKTIQVDVPAGKFVTADLNEMKDADTYADTAEESARLYLVKRERPAGQVPDAPFRKTWHEFVFKRLVRMAAEQGFDKVAWTTGDQQAERYDLSKQIDRIQYSKSKAKPGNYNVIAYAPNGRDALGGGMMYGKSEAELEEIVGKEITKKIVNGEGVGANNGRSDSKEKVLSGLDLKVGGEGMKGFYDKILVDFANKFGKKYGAKVDETRVVQDQSRPMQAISVDDFRAWMDENHPDETVMDKWESKGKFFQEYLQARKSEGHKVHSMEITPQLKEAALSEGFTLFQNEGQGPLGQIHFGNDGINISILKGANASTFIHETGHFYLEVLKDLSTRENAPDQIKQDFDTIRDWLGAKEGEQLTVDQHEQFARGFEGYLLEGKAPTSKLAEAFSRFKVWLLSVYRKMRPNVEFSKEVREVMNRLFATDEELAIAQGDYPPLFNDLSAIGMNKKQEDRYIQARMEARLAAEEELTKKLMADFRKSEQQFYKEKRKGVREEVEAELRATREYTAVAILQGEFTVGKDDQNFKINTKSLKDIGAKVGDMPRGISAPDGLHVEMAAELLNYLSGADLVKALTGLPKLDVAVEKLTDQRMAEYYPDSLVDGTIGEEALKAMHNEKRAELLEMELAHLAVMDTSVLKDITRRVVRRPPSRKQVREEAIRIIGTTKPKDLKPHLYQRAEVKAAKEAGQALVKGDIDAAFEAKQRELLNHELYRQASAARDQINAAMVDFRKFRQSDEKLAKNRDMDLVNTGRAILAAFGVGQQEADQYLAAEILSKMQKYDPEMYQTAKAIYDDATENGAGPWQNVPFDDFAAMQQSVDALWDLAKNVKQIEVDGKKMDLEQVKGELIAQSGKFTDKKAKAEYTETAGPWQKTKSKLLSARADLIRVEHWAEAMDVNGNREFTSYMFRPIADAATKYRLQKVEVIQAYEKIIRAHEQNMTRDPIESAELGHRFKTKTELLMAVLHSGNESNLRKLLVGRGWGTVDETGRLDTSKWDAFIKRMQDTGVLTKADYDFTQQIWDLMESLKPGAQQAHKQMYGYYFKEITTDGFSTPFGDYRGGYIPAKIDVNESEDIDIRQERESFEKNNNSWQFPTTGRGFTKSRVEQYAAPLTLDMNMLGGHIDSVLRFTNIEPRVKEVSRIVMDKGFREALRQVDPAVAKDALVPWLQRAAQQQVVIPSRDGLGRLTDAMASHIRSTVAVQIMFGNVTNTLQQLTGVVVAGVKIKPKYLRNALVRYVTDRKGMNEDIQDRSEWMRSIQGATVYESSQAIQNIIVQPSTFENIQQFTKRHTYFLQSATQNLVNNVVWTAGYNQALESGMTEAQAAKEADAKVRMTQGTVNPEDVSRFETGTQTERLFKQFVGYFNMLANLNAFEIQKIARETGLKKGAGRAFYVYSMGVMLPAVLSELIVRAMSGKGFDEDDDDFYLDDAMSAFFGSQFKTIAATVPYGGQVAVSVYNRFNNQRYDDRLSLSPVISVIEGTAGVPYELYKNIAEDADNEKKITKDVLTLVGVMSSLPAGPIGKPVGYLMDVNSGKAQPTGPIDFTRGLVTGKSGNSNK